MEGGGGRTECVSMPPIDEPIEEIGQAYEDSEDGMELIGEVKGKSSITNDILMIKR